MRAAIPPIRVATSGKWNEASATIQHDLRHEDLAHLHKCLRAAGLEVTAEGESES
jgi:hypothetical protein